jgi:hypothetical protein
MFPAEARVESLTGAVTLNGRAVKVGDAVQQVRPWKRQQVAVCG